MAQDITITDAQKVKRTVKLVDAGGQPVPPVVPPTWNIGDVRVQVVPAVDGLSAEFIAVGPPVGPVAYSAEYQDDALGVHLFDQGFITVIAGPPVALVGEWGTPEPK